MQETLREDPLERGNVPASAFFLLGQRSDYSVGAETDMS